ncbi:MAG TPA: hypothetical protein VG796_29700 [Verrucomicrobiales bacterium]|nr:hypothetical protein [Verrucomicrobiales bacterium]
MPQLVALYNRNKDKGFMLIGQHRQSATDEEVQAVVKKMKVKFPITKNGSGPSKGNGIPHTLVFDSTGKLVFEGHPGDADFDKAIKRAMKAVAASTTPSSGLGPKSSGTTPTTPGTKPGAPAALIAERAWTNTDGKTMMAALISLDGETAKFKKKDGSTFSYPLSKLNAEDQATIKEAASK